MNPHLLRTGRQRTKIIPIREGGQETIRALRRLFRHDENSSEDLGNAQLFSSYYLEVTNST